MVVYLPDSWLSIYAKKHFLMWMYCMLCQKVYQLLTFSQFFASYYSSTHLPNILYIWLCILLLIWHFLTHLRPQCSFHLCWWFGYFHVLYNKGWWSCVNISKAGTGYERTQLLNFSLQTSTCAESWEATQPRSDHKICRVSTAWPRSLRWWTVSK